MLVDFNARFHLQVMLGGKNIEEGFGIAYRVIQVKKKKKSINRQ